MTPEAELRARVERGATFLDQAEPRWWKRVEEQLVLSDCSRCVLGQLFGGEPDSFDTGLDELAGSYDDTMRYAWACRHGFDLPVGFIRDGVGYSVLDRLWTEAIEARRADPDRYVP